MTDNDIIPALDSVISAADVRQKGGGKFAATYIPWGKISQLLREHAPCWQPIAVPDLEGNMAHVAPDGSFYLMMAFRHHVDGQVTQPVPHAVMDHKMVAMKNPSSRDLSDAFVRGLCKAAALTFGLGIEMWTGDPLDDKDDQIRLDNAEASHLPQPWDSREHAEDALKRCATEMQMAAWRAKSKASKFAGIDREDLLAAYSQRVDEIVEERKSRECLGEEVQR